MRSRAEVQVEIGKLYGCPHCEVFMKIHDFDKMDCPKCGKKYRLDIEQLSYLQGYRQCLDDITLNKKSQSSDKMPEVKG